MVDPFPGLVKVLGGSSSINGLLYVRGQPQDFDQWRQLGNDGWSWDDVLPYLNAENWKVRSPKSVASVDMNVLNKVDRKIIDAWVQAATNAGFQRTRL